MILAGIDIGTNTLRLLVADIGPDSFQEIYADRRVTRLGQELDGTGALSPEARERTLDALQDFSAQLDRHAVLHMAAVGTSAFRNASNSSAFIDEVKKRTSISIRVISGEAEARLMLLGVARALTDTAAPRKRRSLGSALVIDIGGGSTEVIVNRPGMEPVIVSLPLGAVYLTERFIRHDPPTRDERERLVQAVRDELDMHAGAVQPDPDSRCIGTAGTITTLAAIDQGLTAYDPARINRSVLTRQRIDDIVQRLGSLPVAERRTVRGIDRGREDIIFAGAVVARELMNRFSFSAMLVSDGGLREGIVLDLYERFSGNEQA